LPDSQQLAKGGYQRNLLLTGLMAATPRTIAPPLWAQVGPLPAALVAGS
jgi:hypothetical protein